MADDPQQDALDDLTQRLEDAKRAQTSEDESRPKRNMSGMSEVVRVMSELLGGVVVGSVAGYFLDQWLDTTPWLFILCFFFGVAGSGLTIYRTTSAKGNESDRSRTEN
jgi:F0F1-type ATP synthase assembly protein I